MTNQPTQAAKTDVFVFGLEGGKGKPKGARFPAIEADKLKIAVEVLKLEFCNQNSEQLAPLVAKLPVGRLFARGKTFVPYISKELFEKLRTAVAATKEVPGPIPAEAQVAPEAETQVTGEQAATDIKPPVLPPLASGLPQNWESIAPGNLVLAFEGPGEGYWETIVISRENEILTLRYRDYPKVPKFERHISTVALINPRPA